MSAPYLAEAWARYRASAIAPTTPEDQLAELRRAYFGGALKALACFDGLRDFVESCSDECYVEAASASAAGIERPAWRPGAGKDSGA